MDRDFEASYHALERSHWWFTARHDVLLRLLRRDRIAADAQILEIGCSSGALLEDLTAAGYRNLHGLDLSPSAVEACHRRGLSNVFCGDGARPDLPPESCDVIIASDVLEHIAEDHRAVQAWFDLLRPQGRLYVFVPAHAWLWSRHDEVNQHFRRYSRRGLVARLEEAGFTIEQVDGWNAALLSPVAAIRLAQRVARACGLSRGQHQLGRTPAIINTLLKFELSLENRWLEWGGRLPLGISLFAVARKTALPTSETQGWHALTTGKGVESLQR